MGSLLDKIKRNRENAFEKLADILPGYKGYKEKEMRREADRILRENLVRRLNEQWNKLPDIQKKLISKGKIGYLDDVETIVNRMQTFIDKVKGGAAGYGGLFDAIRVKETELDALYDFDLALLQKVDDLKSAVANLRDAVNSGSPSLDDAISKLQELTSALNDLWDRRNEVFLGEAGKEVGSEAVPAKQSEESGGEVDDLTGAETSAGTVEDKSEE
jgi:hypothetical protein